jgi:hypothetical protein
MPFGDLFGIRVGRLMGFVVAAIDFGHLIAQILI